MHCHMRFTINMRGMHKQHQEDAQLISRGMHNQHQGDAQVWRWLLLAVAEDVIHGPICACVSRL